MPEILSLNTWLDLNTDPDLNTPEVAVVTHAVIGREVKTKRKAANINADSLGNIITDAELGQAAVREAEAIFIAGGGVAPAWFGPTLNNALAPVNAQFENIRLHSRNFRVCLLCSCFFGNLTMDFV